MDFKSSGSENLTKYADIAGQLCEKKDSGEFFTKQSLQERDYFLKRQNTIANYVTVVA